MNSTLAAAGLRHILSETFGIEAAILSSPQALQDSSLPVELSYYFTDESTLAGNLSFFLPNKTKTVVVGKHQNLNLQPMLIDGQMCESDVIDSIEKIIAKSKNANTVQQQGKLSPRETDVLKLVVAGHINKEIADELNISINTVMTHRKNIATKLGIKSASGWSIYAMMNGIVVS